ncbi:MAG TPA: Fur family transcriptional regulator [Aggregatilineales bacterium]|jgi:Fe2+ or Zn2+ uptake regulation protein|nr:Fur family transcriptional regulator [Aggregatilineales bacterium]HPV08300.1 Fur family transcriptional regulator [Aggregatilineales bacterium]HQA70003.1 Fur family transcriptional regulator [Aggregatilineales bacterium]
MPGLQYALNRLREAGRKVTAARRAVLTVLEEHDGHLTSAEIIEHVHALSPSISRATVFRTLELLTELAIIRPTYLESRTPTYVLLTHEGHHSHIICVNCNRVIELDSCLMDDLAHVYGERHDVHIVGHLLEFYGVCAACSPAESPGTS